MKTYIKIGNQKYECTVCHVVRTGAFAKHDTTKCCAGYKPVDSQVHLDAIETARAKELIEATRKLKRPLTQKQRRATVNILKEIEKEFFADAGPRRQSTPLQKLAYAYTHLGWPEVRNAARSMARHYARVAIESFIQTIQTEGDEIKKEETLKRVLGQIYD